MQDELLIKSLSADLEAKVSIVPSQRPLLIWMIFALVILTVGLMIHSIRPDAGHMLEKFTFYLELSSALVLGIVAAGSALAMRIPGNRAPTKVLISLVGIWLISLFLQSMSMKELGIGFNMKTEWACFRSIILLGILPAALLIYFVRRGASTEPQQTLALVAVAVSAMAAAVLPIACGGDGLIHLFVGHAAPLFALSAVAWVSGRKILSW